MRELLNRAYLLLDEIKEFHLLSTGAGFDELMADLEAELAKPEPEHIGYQFQDTNGFWHSFMNEQHFKNTVADGTWPIRPIYTSPPRQQAPVRLSDDDLNSLLSLARRTLWIALCWNDHNFDDYLLYAKADADRAGITSVDAANAWLASIEALIKANGLVGEG